MTDSPSANPERILQGIPVSPGIAIADLRVIARGFSCPEAYPIPDNEIVHEKERFHAGLDRTKKQVQALYDRIFETVGKKEAQIFEAHMLFLEDQMLISSVETELEKRKQNIEAVFYAVIQNYLELLRRVPDPYLRDKVTDIEDISIRVLKNISEEEPKEPLFEEEANECIIVAYDLAPSDTATMDTASILGFATEIGSNNSHTSILARSMGIPAIVGVSGAVIESKNLQSAILDGYKGLLILDPSPETLEAYRRLQAEKIQAFQELATLKDLPTVTLDGKEFTLGANVEFPHEFESIKAVGAEGIGLFRTEFFLLNTETIPGEDEQATRYAELIQGCAPDRVIFRTLDAGGDKLPCEDLLEPEPNPFLGWRGIRVSLSRPTLFKDQLKAILRASVHGPVGVMFPMVSGITELKRAKQHWEDCKQELDAAGIPYGKDILIGVMIEVPSAAVIADILAKEVDFFSIGTNDLTQYTIAVDRVNHRVARLFRTSHPGVIRLINQTIRASDKAGIWTAICGEAAANIELLPLLIGMGAKELSVGVNVVPVIRYAIRSLNYEECRKMAEEALMAPDSNTILKLSRDLAVKSYPKLFS